MTDVNDWTFWQSALAGGQPDWNRGQPASGFYRDRQRAVAIWYGEDDGVLCCKVSSGFVPRHPDQVEEIFASCCRTPITHEVYQAFVETGRWPENIESNLEAARAETLGAGHNSGQPHEEVLGEIEILDRAFATWLTEIGGKIASEEHDAKAETFKDRFLSLEKRAKAGKELEKRPVLDAAKAIEDKWRGPIERADAGKRTVGTALTPYRVERDRLRDLAKREAQEQAAKAVQDNRPPPAPVRQLKSGLRTVHVPVVTDLRAAAGQIAALNNPPTDFIDVVRTIGMRMIKAGIEVRGIEIREEKRA